MMKLPWRIRLLSRFFLLRVCCLIVSLALVLGILVVAGWGSARAAPLAGGPTLNIISFDGNTLTLKFANWATGQSVTLGYSASRTCSPAQSLPNATFSITTDPFITNYIWPSTGIQPGTYYLCATGAVEGTIASQQTITVNRNGTIQSTPGVTPTKTGGSATPTATATETPPLRTNSSGSNGFLPNTFPGVPTPEIALGVLIILLSLVFAMTFQLQVRSRRRQALDPQPPATPIFPARVSASGQPPATLSEPAIPAAGPIVPALPAPPARTIFCPQCGLEQEIGSSPCPRCGYDLHQALTLVRGKGPSAPVEPPAPARPNRAPANADALLLFAAAPDGGQKLPGKEEIAAQKGPLSGLVLGGKYELQELLGRGGVGAVYQAYNQLLKRPQAIKVLLEHYGADPKFQERFRREAQTLAALDHANILPVHDFGLEDNRAYLVMPFISGGTLHQFIQRHPDLLSFEQVRRALQHIAAALDHAHAQGVVHLDLKPANVLLHPDGRLLLSDFGLAHLLEVGAVEGGTSLQFGTPAYMAPEHIEGRPEAASDIYALGIILYQLLTGKVPFQGSSPLAILRKQATEPPPALRVSRPELPVALESVLGRALAKEPAARYQTAGALLSAFQNVVSAS
jgi:hypothetical protein